MNLKTLLIAASVAALPLSAGALTLQVGGLTIEDNDLNDSNANANVISYFGLGGVSVQTTLFTDTNGKSLLQLNVSETLASGADLAINTSHDDFGAGQGNPTTVVFDMNGSEIGGGADTVQGSAYVDDAVAVFSTDTLVGSGSISAPADDIAGEISTVLSDPFTMSIFTTIKQGTTASYDATMTAQPVPVPAGILLMGTAIAGFGVMRRRKKAA